MLFQMLSLGIDCVLQIGSKVPWQFLSRVFLIVCYFPGVRGLWSVLLDRFKIYSLLAGLIGNCVLQIFSNDRVMDLHGLGTTSLGNNSP